MKRYLSLVLLAFLVSGFAVAADPKKPARITYDDHVLPILKDKCVSCHNQDKKRGGIVLNNYTALMAGGSSGAAVKVGDPEGSLLYKLMAHTQEPIMPPKSPKPARETLEVIHKWIAGGAPETSGSKVVIPDRPKVDFTLPSVVKGKPAGPPPMPPASLSRNPVVRASADTAVSALASSPWAPLLAVGGQKQVLLYHSDSLELLGVLPFPEGTPHVLKFSRNGSLLLAGGGRGGKSGRVVIWSVTKGERLFAVGEENDAVLAADISPDQTRIALGGPGKLVRIYSTKDGKLLAEIKKHTDWVTSLEFSPDGVLLASGDRSSGLFVWEAFNGREYFTLRGHTAAITDISWRGDSNVLASASEDSTIKLYEMENGNQIRTWGAHGGGAQAVRYSRDGKIVSAGRDRLVRLWDGNGGGLRNFEAFPDVALKAIFSHDGARVVGGDWTGQIVVWNTADGKRVGTLTANPATSAEQLAQALKTLAEKQKAHETQTVVARTSEAAFAKANADLATAQKVVNDTTAALGTAKAKLTQAQTTVTTAQTAVKNALDETRAKEALSKALADAAGKVKLEADKEKGNTALLTAQTRALALAGQVSAELTLAQKALADVQAAAKAVEPALAQAQQAFNTASAAAAAAPKNLPALQNAVKAAQVKAAADRAALDQLVSELNQAKAAVARLQAAGVVKTAGK